MGTFHITQEGPVNALALNRDNTQVAIGGRNVFKVYVIEENKFREICNLRASKHLNLSFSCNDVSWSSIDDNYLATAATNGHVCVWNLAKSGKAMQEQDYQDHKRTVNKVNFHATEPNKLISGSQDGTMRYFDIRGKSAVSVFHSNTESVRDVQFSPHNPYTFAAVSDNGSVQLWDIRKPDKCQQQYSAHSGPVFACDWHPESTWLATASRDKTIKVWDLATNKPTLEYTIHTIASIGHVKWRPHRKYHIASCALVVDSSINIWDVRRPYIPFASFNEHRDISSGVAWKGDPHVFLSSGRDCTLYQHVFNDANRPASKANPQSISLNNKGEVLFAQKVAVNNNNIVNNNPITKATSYIRKISNTQSFDTFHQASSTLQQFLESNHIHNQDCERFLALAKNYVLHGRSVSEMCEHNAAVAREFGKSYMSVIWKIIKTMYGEEFMQNSAHFENYENFDKETKEETSHSDTQVEVESSVNELEDNNEGDQSSRDGDTSVTQFSGADDETESEDQVDHAPHYNNGGFPSYLTLKTTGLPKGDFSFGENELDMEIDGLISESFADYQNGYRNYNLIVPQELQEADYCSFPNEAFPIRHEILNPSPPPEQFPNHHSPDIPDEPMLAQMEEPQQIGLLTVSKPRKKTTWDPGNLVVEALRHHANMGDIQSAACILMVIGENRKYLPKLDEYTQEHWLLGYIELLNKYKLWNLATQIIKLSWIPSINQLNQQSTRINTCCSKCSKPLLRMGWLCDRCHSFECAFCSVCHQVVKGLYVWCQGCTHGGHVSHIKQWLEKNKVCPTGCGHRCEISGADWDSPARVLSD